MLLTLIALSLSFFLSPALILPTLQALPTPAGLSSGPLILAHDVPLVETCNWLCRSKWTILLSCFFTAVACVYSAIHPNLPNPKASYRMLLWEKVTVLLLMICCSGVVMMWAIGQWFGARLAVKKINELQKPGLKWDMIHGHLLQMGGLGRDDNKHVLYLDDLLLLIEGGQIDPASLNIPARDIENYSKAGIFLKTLAATQISWFVLQCIVRYTEGLVVTQLEVVTLAFAVLNVTTYVAWWQKPRNVLTIKYLPVNKFPPLVTTDPSPPVSPSLAACVASLPSGSTPPATLPVLSINEESPLPAILPASPPPESAPPPASPSSQQPSNQEYMRQPPFTNMDERILYLWNDIGERFQSIQEPRPLGAWLRVGLLWFLIVIFEVTFLLGTLMVYPCFYIMANIWVVIDFRNPFSCLLPRIGSNDDGYVHRLYRIPSHTNSNFLYFGVIVIGTMVGAIHLLSWNFNFLTQFDETNWRQSTVTLTKIPSVALLLVLGRKCFRQIGVLFLDFMIEQYILCVGFWYVLLHFLIIVGAIQVMRNTDNSTFVDIG
ncbi:hypothetical protein BDN72DRAFT_337904 [Pluteus cervinus]|uniref:Uncharacterized protein n=1 Tax=Pluteus cervinus TaxID=181527 RepID=A0ACD3AE21_9AGAR|nr:hypothetical protein BDN72DRAFT_337904 [Pluteus cervinus]